MGSTNYASTFIQVAEDCPVAASHVPPAGNGRPTVAALQYALIDAQPYALTSDDVLFEVHATRQGIPSDARSDARAEFFAKDQPCLRSSALGKRYGWGIHSDAEGRVALVGVDSDSYRALVEDAALHHVRAMRTKRA